VIRRKRIQLSILLLISLSSAFVAELRDLPQAGADTLTSDIFQGSFQAGQDLLPFTELIFSISPKLDVSNVTIRFFIYSNLSFLGAIETRSAFVGKGIVDETRISLEAWPLANLVEAYVEAELTSEGVVVSKSYFAKVRPSLQAPTLAVVIPLENPSQKKEEPPSTRATPFPAANTLVTVTGRWEYEILSGGSNNPIRYATVELWEDLLFDQKLATSFTNASGYYSFSLTMSSSKNLYVKVFNETAAAKVTNSGGGVYWGRTETRTVNPTDPSTWNLGTWFFARQYPNWMAMDTIIDEYQWIQNQVLWTRSQVQVIWPTGNWPQTDGNVIYLPDRSVQPWGRATLLHEYAHTVMYAAYGNRFPPGPGPPGGHKICDESSGGFALVEGWAEFMEGAVDNNPFPADWGVPPCKTQTLEANDWFNHVDSGDLDGDVIEGSVASILWDVFDCPSNDDDDFCSQFSRIWAIILNNTPNNINEFWDDWFDRSYDTTSELWETYYTYGIKKSNPTISTSWSISPTTVQAGQSFTAIYPISSPFRDNADAWLGLSIRKRGSSSRIDDPANDTAVVLTPGSNTKSRIFRVPANASPGEYEVILGLWSDNQIGQGVSWYLTEWRSILTVTSPPQIIDKSLSTSTANPGQTITFNYTINNPNSTSVNVTLGAQIRTSNSGQWIDDFNNDRTVTLPPGTSTHFRSFQVPPNGNVSTPASPGWYDANWVIFQPGNPGNRYDEEMTLQALQVQCNYSISPTSQSFPSSGGTGSVNVTAPAGCNWTATSNASWITITSGSSGNGNGTVNYSVAANNSTSPRAGTMTIAGQTFTVNQQGITCTYTISPASNSFTSAGGSGSFNVNAPSGCNWTATSNASWISITSGNSGSGNGTVNYTVANNPNTSSRQDTITVRDSNNQAVATHTVNQSGISCNYSINPTNNSFSSAGGSGSFNVTAPGNCQWTASSNDSWITINSGGSGSGNGTVNYSVAQNNNPNSRQGSITVRDSNNQVVATHTVNQSGISCNYSINPISRSFDSSGGQGSFTISVASGCAWNVQSDANWINITSGNNGNGNGTVNYSVGVNNNPNSRQGTITIRDGNNQVVATHTVTQGGVATGIIQIVKDTVPDDPQDFSFTTTGSGLSGFSLDDDGDNANDLPNTKTFTGLNPGNYTVTETAVSGFSTSISCSDPDGGTTTNGQTATIDLDAGETVTCTFTNTKQTPGTGTITIIKDAIPDSPQDFEFSRSFGTNFSLDDDADPTLSNKATFTDLAPGTYTVTELGPPTGWQFTDLVCADPDGGTTVDLATRTANIDLDAGETVTCTFTNKPIEGPANDNFSSAQIINGSRGTVSGSNVGAAKEPCEPNHHNIPGGASVWYRWTAPIGGNATFDTFGSNFDTVLAVYTGDNLCSLTYIASNDDASPGLLQSRVSFNAVAGTTYHIAVDGFGGFSSSGVERAFGDKISTAAVAMGDIVLNWSVVEAQADEDFETGNLSKFPWETGGRDRWIVTNAASHSGNYSARAPLSLRDGRQAYLQVTLLVETGMISFWRKVSSEQNRDFLKFYIDGVLQGQWSGEVDWEQVSFPVTAGEHTFKWVYTKDRSRSGGQDTAWIDDIDFPPLHPCYGVTISSSPASVTYRPTPTRPDRKTIRVTVTNQSGAPQTVIDIVKQPDEPFEIVSISPPLPQMIADGARQTFSVLTERAAGSGRATARRPYFEITLSCGMLTLASEPSLLMPLQPNDVQVKLQGNHLQVEAQGANIATVRLQLYDLLGLLILDQEGRGNTMVLPAKTAQGTPLANGVYLYVVRVRGFDEREYVSEVRKLVILREKSSH
jgi:hypothetical protein